MENLRHLRQLITNALRQSDKIAKTRFLTCGLRIARDFLAAGLHAPELDASAVQFVLDYHEKRLQIAKRKRRRAQYNQRTELMKSLGLVRGKTALGRVIWE